MANLWKETIECLNENGKTFDDVLFIKGDNFDITKDNFEGVAKKTNYDNSYGAQQVARDIVLVGENWWIERAEYDGSEWWEFKIKPIDYGKTQAITKLAGGMWDTLSKLNDC